MAARPQISVQTLDGKSSGNVVMPSVLLASIRPDVVHFVHTNMAKNHRQAYAVSENAGHQHSAESWGTGRAVARVPRVSGGGTGRSGQAAFANMVRKGRMYAPTKTWRKWHHKINVNQKRYAVASALAASAIPALVMARGHRVDNVPEVPLVVEDKLQNVTKTKDAIKALTAVGAFQDVEKAAASKKMRAGRGKLRNRRHVLRRGPLVVYNEDHGVVKAMRNLPGVECCQVGRLNLLQLAPGGHLGRFVVWTKGAVEKLNSTWGSVRRESESKKGYTLPRPIMTNTDLARIINSDEIQSKLRPAKEKARKIGRRQHKNPLKNLGVKVRLNPYALAHRRSELLAQKASQERKAAILAGKRGQPTPAQLKARKSHNAHKKQQKATFKAISADDLDKTNVGVAGFRSRIPASQQVAK